MKSTPWAVATVALSNQPAIKATARQGDRRHRRGWRAARSTAGNEGQFDALDILGMDLSGAEWDFAHADRAH